MAVKPIFIVKTPSYLPLSEISTMYEDISSASISDDYYVLFVEGDSGDFEFECFFEKDFNHVKYEELKQIIKDSCAH